MKNILIVLLVTLITAAGAFAQAGVAGKRWQLTEINGQQVVNSGIYIEFDGLRTRLSGFSGCNRFSGTYRLSGETLRAGNIASTKMGCIRLGLMRAEREFLEALGDANRLRKTGVNLNLLNGRSRLLRFRSVSSHDDGKVAELTAKKWMLKSIGNIPVNLTKNRPYLTFDPSDSKAGGNGGCNGFGGSYEVNGQTIKFGNMISTMMACEFESRMMIERRFLDGLQNANRFEMKGNKLLIFKGEKLQLELEGAAK